MPPGRISPRLRSSVLTERFEISVRRICERYGLKLGPLFAKNRNVATPRGTDFSVTERQVILRFNELDVLIYKDARRRFRSDCAEMTVNRAGTDTLERPAYT